MGFFTWAARVFGSVFFSLLSGSQLVFCFHVLRLETKRERACARITLFIILFLFSFSLKLAQNSKHFSLQFFCFSCVRWEHFTNRVNNCSSMQKSLFKAFENGKSSHAQIEKQKSLCNRQMMGIYVYCLSRKNMSDLIINRMCCFESRFSN